MKIKDIDPESLMIRLSFKWKIKAPVPISYTPRFFGIFDSNIRFDLLNLALENLIATESYFRCCIMQKIFKRAEDTSI